MKYLISLGSNLGDRKQNIRKAVAGIRNYGTLLSVSDLFQSEPFGVREQPFFFNLVLELDSPLRPFRLLRKCKQLEVELGRARSFRWGPRVIDIDILEWEGESITHPVLTIPHPGLEKRRFVLAPLSQIHPDFHARSGYSVAQLVALCPDGSRIESVGQL